jgi:AraC family transcriptional regulator
LALGRDRLHSFAMAGSLTVTIAGRGRVAHLSNVACTFGKNDKPYPEAHDGAAWTIALVRRGTFHYRSAATNRAHALRPGWLLLGRPATEFECSHDHDGGDECASVAISQQVLSDVAGLRTNAIWSAPPALPPSPRVVALIEQARRDGTDVDELGCLVAEAVVAHVCATSIAEVTHRPTHVGRVHDAMDRIEASCQEPMSLAELADSAGLSPFHFLRVFRCVTGTTPHQYVVGARLRLAVRMLLDTPRPVTEIAYDVGFQDLSNFVRTFHRVVGCSPGMYRRRALER